MSALRQGYALGLTAYGLWGLFPLFFKLLAALPATEILFQRILWSALFSALLLLVWRHRGWWAELRAHPRRLLWLALSGALVACNWLVYIWAVNNAHVVEASLGYYINPLVNILLALVILGERLRPLQWIAVGLAVLGVAQQLWTLGQLPWVSLALALSFAFYGLVRRQTPVAALPGMVVESWMLVPIALVALPLLTPGVSLQAETWQSSLGLLIVLAGPVTLIPLLCFNAAARKLPYSTLGFLQYLAPTLVLIQAVWLYGEPFPRERLFAFICIWTGLAVFSFDLWRASRKLRACSKARELETNKAKGPEEAEFTRGK